MEQTCTPDEISTQISGLRKSDWVDLHGLVSCAVSKLLKPACTSISLLGRGSYHNVYKLVFSDLSEVAASIPNDYEEDWNPIPKQSEIATMRFVYESGLYPDIPVPRVYDFDLTYQNPVHAPYVLMDVIKGRQLNNLDNGSKLRGLDAMSPEEQLILVTQLANIQASLSKPVAFDKIGSLSDINQVGELVTITNKSLGGPYHKISDLWYSLLERQEIVALREWDKVETDELPGVSEGTPQKFTKILGQLSTLIPHFAPSAPSHLQLVLHHPDLALRNILWDPDDLTKIAGVIDWGGSQIAPLLLTAHFPGDLMTTGDDPVERPGHPDELWNTIPHDWTSLGDTSKWSPSFGANHLPVDDTIRASAMVRRYYLRQHFAVSYARARSEWDGDMTGLSVFADAPFYLKFHEVLVGGVEKWIQCEKWIDETYWRMRLSPSAGSTSLIIGPNHYVGSVVRPLCNLGSFDDQPDDAEA